MKMSPLAELVLQTHQTKPDAAFYNIRVLGGMISPRFLDRLAEAYEQLESAGLVERTGRVVAFFDDVVPLYRLARKRRRSAEPVEESRAPKRKRRKAG